MEIEYFHLVFELLEKINWVRPHRKILIILCPLDMLWLPPRSSHHAPSELTEVTEFMPKYALSNMSPQRQLCCDWQQARVLSSFGSSLSTPGWGGPTSEWRNKETLRLLVEVEWAREGASSSTQRRLFQKMRTTCFLPGTEDLVQWNIQFIRLLLSSLLSLTLS